MKKLAFLTFLLLSPLSAALAQELPKAFLFEMRAAAKDQNGIPLAGLNLYFTGGGFKQTTISNEEG